MNNTNNILALQVIPSNYINNNIISVNISYVLPKYTPNGVININIPKELYVYSNSSCYVTDNSSCQIIQPQILIQFTNPNPNITHSQTVILSNIRNNPSYSQIDPFII